MTNFINVEDLTGDEVNALRKLLAAGVGTMPGPTRREWPEPALVDEEEIRQLAPVPRPVPPPPEAEDAAHNTWQRQVGKWEDEDMSRCRRLAGLGVQRRSQLECQRLYPADSLPLWRCSVEAVGDTPDSGLFPLLVAASTEKEARARYCEVVGLTNGEEGLLRDGRHTQRLIVTPHEPAAVAAE
jgi:hypothetical protein